MNIPASTGSRSLAIFPSIRNEASSILGGSQSSRAQLTWSSSDWARTMERCLPDTAKRPVASRTIRPIPSIQRGLITLSWMETSCSRPAEPSEGGPAGLIPGKISAPIYCWMRKLYYLEVSSLCSRTSICCLPPTSRRR